MSEKRHKKGEDHWLSKLTADQVRDIRKRVEEGESKEDLAVEFKVTVVTIKNIYSRKTWKHIQ